MIDNTIVHSDIEDIFVLSGGGARGLYQFHVVQLLTELGYKPKMLIGTSAGTLNSFAIAKGLIKETYALYDVVGKTNGAPITKPLIAKITDQGLKPDKEAILSTLLKGINIWDAPKLIFKKSREKLFQQLLQNASNIKSLMSNEPLIETVTKLHELKSTFDIPFFLNVVSLTTGKLVQLSPDDFDNPNELIKAVVASTTIPIIWQDIPTFKTKTNQYFRLADSGLRESSPLAGLFDQMRPDKYYRIWVINCNRREMVDDNELDNLLQIGGRMASIMLNELLITDLQRTIEINELALKFGDKISKRYVPINIIEYSGNRGVFDFNEASFAEQLITAKEDVSKFLSQNVQ